MVEVLVDDLDGSEGADTVRIGWNGEWREPGSRRRTCRRYREHSTDIGSEPARIAGWACERSPTVGQARSSRSTKGTAIQT